MKFVVLSDMHGDLAYIDQLDEVISSSDGIIFGGDFTRFNEPETGLPALKKLVKKHESIFAVLGNCDEPDFIEKLEEEDISVQGSLVFYE
ncbi:MAG: metallophosphoesterase family protein, partial [Spirochaetaceae bacterium]|nr:metallophosphoesterase family protein [Spirochaetaceae bacterium]